MFEKMGKMVRHNPGQAIALIVCIIAAVWMFGCESKVQSMTESGRKVTRAELQVEKTNIVADLQAQIAAIDRQISTTQMQFGEKTKRLDQLDATKQKLAEFGIVALQGGTVNPVGAAVALLGIFGLGAVVDNRKKDGLITDIKKTKPQPGIN